MGYNPVRPALGSDLREGHTVTVSKKMVVRDVFLCNNDLIVKGDDGRRYPVSEWEFTHATPSQWPPLAGDIWQTSLIRYAAVERDGEVILMPTNVSGGVSIYPDQYQMILDQHPVLVLR